MLIGFKLKITTDTDQAPTVALECRRKGPPCLVGFTSDLDLAVLVDMAERHNRVEHAELPSDMPLAEVEADYWAWATRQQADAEAEANAPTRPGWAEDQY